LAFTQLSEQIKDTINRVDGFTTGTLVVNENEVSLLLKDGTWLILSDQRTIEVRNGSEYVSVTYQDALEKKTSEGWPLLAGLYARVKKIK
jgi:hypothetical protein